MARLDNSSRDVRGRVRADRVPSPLARMTALGGVTGDDDVDPDDDGPDDGGDTATSDGSDDDDDDTTTGGSACGGGGEPCCPGDTCDDGLSCLGDGCSCVAVLELGERHTCVAKLDGTVWC